MNASIKIRAQRRIRTLLAVFASLLLLLILATQFSGLATPVEAWLSLFAPDPVLSPNNTADGRPNETLVYTHTLKNNGDTDDTFDITLDSSQSYVVASSSSSIVLAAGATSTFTVQVDVPSNATHGTIDTTTVTATAQSDAALVDTVTDKTTVVTLEVAVGPNKTGSLTAGNSIQYTHLVTNTGTTDDIYDLTVTGNHSGYTRSVDPTSISLVAGATGTITVTIDVPSNEPSAIDTNLVTAQSQLNTSVDNGATDTTTVTAAAPTNTPTITNTPDPNVYADVFEPNNDINNSAELVSGGSQICDLTLWPTTDEDWYRFYAKGGFLYTVEAKIDTNFIGLDTFLTVLDTGGQEIASDDDSGAGKGSELSFLAPVNGYYFARVSNLDGTNPTNKRYCIQAAEAAPTATPTPRPEATIAPDSLEDNGSFESATLLQPNESLSADFVPPIPPGPDNDYYRIWVKPGLYYTCSTDVGGSAADTNIIIYDHNRIGLAGNDDVEIGNLGSEVGFLATYTGWLYVLVGPVQQGELSYEDSYLHTYNIKCDVTVATPTPTATATPLPFTGGTGNGGVTFPGGKGGGSLPTAIPTMTPTLDVTQSANGGSVGTPAPFTTPIPTPRPAVVFQPLATPTPAASAANPLALNVTLYYDQNQDFKAELTEGISEMAVALYDNATGQLLALGYTNDAGMVPFGPYELSGPVRIVVPYLNFNQLVTPDVTSVELRIAPQQLPNFIP